MIDQNAVIPPETSLLKAMEIMDREQRKLLIICKDSRFLGVVSIGDIQRAILNKTDLALPAINICRNDIIYARKTDSQKVIRQLMTKERIECMPVVDDDMLVDMIEWEEIFPGEDEGRHFDVMLPVVIMAGGRGTRLNPLTNIIPKPLIPLSEKTIIEEIMGQFSAVGCKDYYISVNYKAQMIKEYLGANAEQEWNIQYIQEDKPLGTAGSLRLLNDKLKGTFFMTNCDILLDIDLQDLYKYHKNNQNVITMVSVLKKYVIPYGTIETGKNGVLIDLMEKPETVYQINSGLYVMEPEIFSFIEPEEVIHVTDLAKKIMKSRKRVGVFPVSEGSWRDMGNWKDYISMIDQGGR